MKKCKELDLYDCDSMTDDSFSHEMHVGIKKLRLSSCRKITSINKFVNATDIEWDDVYSDSIIEFDKLGPGVKKIKMMSHVEDINLNNFTDCEELDISCCRNMTEKSFDKLVNLRVLDCDTTKVSDLNFLKKCVKLNCNNCCYLLNSGIVKIASGIKIMSCAIGCGLSDLNGLVNCESLNVTRNSSITNESISKLGRGLKNLDVSSTKVSDLNHLTDCIHLDCVRCDNITLDSIRGMKSLKNIRCNPNKLIGLEQLKNIKTVSNEFYKYVKIEDLKLL